MAEVKKACHQLVWEIAEEWSGITGLESPSRARTKGWHADGFSAFARM